MRQDATRIETQGELRPPNIGCQIKCNSMLSRVRVDTPSIGRIVTPLEEGSIKALGQV